MTCLLGLIIDTVYLGLPLCQNFFDRLEKKFLKQGNLDEQIADLSNGCPWRNLNEGLKIHATVLLSVRKSADYSRPVNMPGATKINSRPITKP